MALRLRELEHLAESLAHDLKAPGERVQELTALLRKEYADRLDERGKRWLQLLEANGQDLVNRVKGLLDIAGIGGPRKALETVHPDLILRQVLEGWSNDLRLHGVRMHVTTGFPFVVCHSVSLRQIFENLISNAIKFSGNRPEFAIRITAERHNGQVCVAVADNGIGIPVQQRERVFEPFVRLNPDLAVGNGIGLTIVKRLVESYGGQVWIESNAEGGCTVRFTLPLSERTPSERLGARRP